MGIHHASGLDHTRSWIDDSASMTIPFPPVARAAPGSTGGEQADMARHARRSRRGGVVLRGKIRIRRNSLSSLAEASLRRALRDAKVKESLCSLFALPRAAAGSAAGRASVGRPFVAHRRLSEGDGHARRFATRLPRAALIAYACGSIRYASDLRSAAYRPSGPRHDARPLPRASWLGQSLRNA